MSLNIANAYPLPIGVTVSFSWGPQWQAVSGLYTTPNFMLTDKGLWTVTLNLSDDGSSTDQVILNQTTGTVGLYNGTNTVILTMARSGYYSLAVPPGGATYNFTSVNIIKMAGVTIASGGVLGP